MNAALWRTGDKGRAAKCLGNERVHVPPCSPQIPRGMGRAYPGFVPDKLALGQVFHRIVRFSPFGYRSTIRSCS